MTTRRAGGRQCGGGIRDMTSLPFTCAQGGGWEGTGRWRREDLHLDVAKYLSEIFFHGDCEGA